MKKRKILFAILSFVWMVFIFYMSSRNGSLSQNDSDYVRTMIGKIFVKDFNSYDTNSVALFIRGIVYYVRKCGHLSEFAILGGLLMCTVTEHKPDKNRILTAFSLSVLYRMSDEFHQLFVEGRAGRISDVFIDSVGICIGIMLSVILIRIYNHITDN